MYGGAQSGIPTIEYPALYRKSLQHLLEEVRPKRLYLGHHFRDANGMIISPQVEGEAVAAVLQASLEMDAKLTDIVGDTYQMIHSPTKAKDYMDHLDRLLLRLAIQGIHGTYLAHSL